MIIWTGLGILIPLILIAGTTVGGLLGTAIGHPGLGLGLGAVLAAVGNWAVWKKVYSKPARVLVDQATGQQVVLKPKHSLFFIPAPAWTWVFGALAVFFTVMGVSEDRKNGEDALKPGYAEFKAADKLINTKDDQPTHGDSDAAMEAAASFSKGMKTMTDTFFTGGSKKNLMTGGEFLTYCHEGDGNIVFICHVPSLRSYKDAEAKDALHNIAWTVAGNAAAKLDPDHKKSLVVGLRGITTYGSVMRGANGSESPDFNETEEGESILIPEFAPGR